MYLGSPDGAGRGSEPVLVTSSIGKTGKVLLEQEGRQVALENRADMATMDDNKRAIVSSKRREG